jgi:hypothetical protein
VQVQCVADLPPMHSIKFSCRFAAPYAANRGVNAFNAASWVSRFAASGRYAAVVKNRLVSCLVRHHRSWGLLFALTDDK